MSNQQPMEQILAENEKLKQENKLLKKKDKKTERLGILTFKSKKLGIIALATAGPCWLSVLGITPFEFIYLLPVSAVTAALSLKTVLGKIAGLSLVFLAPGYIYINWASLAPAL
jgi:uncharacterized membrane protein